MVDYVSEFKLDFDLGNVIKYVSRAGNKFEEWTIEDIQKAKWYLSHAIDKSYKNIADEGKSIWEE